LHDAVVPTRRFDHRATFANVVTEGLLHINVLACLTGEHRRNRVPMVRRGDQHGINVLLFEQAAEIFVFFRS
jgi:hypothetical protein